MVNNEIYSWQRRVDNISQKISKIWHKAHVMKQEEE